MAPLWVSYRENLGTLLRTCDAVGACMAVPATRHYREALAKGDTLRRRRPCVHWVPSPGRERWVAEQPGRKVAVEVAEGATRLGMLAVAREPTVVLLGHEHQGVPAEVLAGVDEVVEIPMVGVGGSLNVAVAGSLVLYRLSGLG